MARRRCSIPGDVPWHQLGRRLDRPATAEEAMNEARLDYTVVKRPLKAIIHGRHYADVPSAFATVRTDTNVVLGVVGSRYEPVQNKDCFSFFDPLIERDEAVYHTAGVLGMGEKIWLLQSFPITSGLEKRVIQLRSLCCSIIAMTAAVHIRVKLTPIRVVCNNTLYSSTVRKRSGSPDQAHRSRNRKTPGGTQSLGTHQSALP